MLRRVSRQAACSLASEDGGRRGKECSQIVGEIDGSYEGR